METKTVFMTTYRKIFLIIWIGLFILVMGLLIYGRQTSDSISEISARLNKLSPDSLECIIIAPANPDWKINLTLDTIKIAKESELNSFTSLFNDMTDKFSGRGIPKTWTAIIILEFKKSKNIKLKVVDTDKGICVFYINTMGNPKYKCDGLKPLMEKLVNYNGLVGRER